MGTLCVTGFMRLRMSLGVANVSESMSSDAVPYTCSARRPRCRPARAALGARRAQAAGGAGAHQALLAQRRALRLRLGGRLRARRPRWSAARSRAGGGRGACGAGARAGPGRTSTTGTPMSLSRRRHSSLCWRVTRTVRLLYLATSASPPVCAPARSVGLQGYGARARQRGGGARPGRTSFASSSASVAVSRRSVLRRPHGHRVSLPPGARS